MFFLYLILFLTDTNLKKCVIVLFLKIVFDRILPGQYKNQIMCDETVDDSLATLKLIPDWFVTSKILKKCFDALYTTENILYFNKDSGN